MDKKARIYVSGHTGMVGTCVVNLLREKGYNNLILKTIEEFDLHNQKLVDEFMAKERPEYVFHFAARVGGIKANIENPAEFLYDNLMIEANVINASYKHGVKKLLYLGSSCIYPRQCRQPMKEEYLLSGKLEPTNEGYAIAKIAGLKLCSYYNKQYNTNFISLVPPNLYGPNDNFDPKASHVISSLIRKFVEAKNSNSKYIELWGTGKARREFLFVEDLADACVYFMEKYDAKDLPEFLNIGSGSDVSIKQLAEIVKEKTGFGGKITWNSSFPDGMPRKLMDSSLSKKLGWKAKTNLQEGIAKTIEWYKNKYRQ
ncbi:MAG: GDP-L-fucose synthase [Candidatus Omnitrophica bacterium]|nr:GDP-L-fucose synthase [Candidatus Omnitrophota bacterium]